MGSAGQSGRRHGPLRLLKEAASASGEEAEAELRDEYQSSSDRRRITSQPLNRFRFTAAVRVRDDPKTTDASDSRIPIAVEQRKTPPGMSKSERGSPDKVRRDRRN